MSRSLVRCRRDENRSGRFSSGDAQRRRAYQILRDELHNKRQAYVVYPLVEESEKIRFAGGDSRG